MYHSIRSQILATLLAAVCVLVFNAPNSNAGGLSTATTPSASASPSVPKVPASFTFNGAGFGHGVGLSQYGAQGMAKEGFTSKQIVEHYYPGTAVKTKTMPTNLVVGLLQNQSASSRRFVALRSEGVGGAGNPLTITIGSTTLTIPEKTTVTAGLLNNKVVLYGKDGTYKDSKKNNLSADAISIAWGKQKQGTKVATVINVAAAETVSSAIANLGKFCTSSSCNHRYKYGTLTIKPYTSISLNVANTLALDDEYLYGLGEVPSLWEPAALEAQVIAARSYAYSKYLNNKTLRSSCACQIYGTPADQNFVGFTKEISTGGSRWVAAVKATTQKVVMSNNQVIQAFFSSSTGGYSQPVKEVWGSSGFPWLTKVDDHWSLSSTNPNASWKKSITQKDLVTKLRKLGMNIKDVASFVVSGNYDSGGVSELTVADSAGRITVISSIPTLLRPTQPNISPEGIRSVFGLKSSYIRSITASTTTTPGDPSNRPDVLTQINVNKWPTSPQFPLATFSISGTVVPKQYGVTISLADQQQSKWMTMATTKTDITGSWKLTWSQVPTGNHTLRISAVNSVGSVRVTSPVISLQGTVTLSGPKSVKPSGVIRLSGDVKPITAAVVIEIQRRTSNSAWKTLGKTHTDIAGLYMCNSKVGKRKTTLQYRVIARDPQLGTIVSKPVTITVK